MKRNFAAVFSVCFLLGLCSCATKETASEQPTAMSGVVADSATAEQDALYCLSGETEQGFYHVGDYNGKARLCFVDYEEEQDKVLCNQSGCTHESERCMASPEEGWNIYFLYALRDGTLAYVEISDEVDAEPERICLADADGSNRRVLATAEDPQMQLELLCADSESLYAMQSDYNGENPSWLCRISLADGTMEPLWEIPAANTLNFCGVEGRDLVWYQFISEAETIPPANTDSDMTEEEVQKALQDHQSLLDMLKVSYRAYLFSLDRGKEQELMTWTSSYRTTGRRILWANHLLYWCDVSSPGALHWISPDGSTGEVEVDWPEEVTAQSGRGDMIIDLNQMLEGKILLTVLGPWGENLIKRYALEPKSGALQEIPLQYMSNASEKPIQIVAKSNDALLVEFEERAENTECIGEDGLPVQTLQFYHRRGIISIEDFFAGTPNYREIRPLVS